MITVITAAHNHAPFLRGAVESVRRQLHQDWEHVVIDDGSTDETPQVLAGLCLDNRVNDAKLRTFRIAHHGSPAALNAGLAKARGEWVAFLDADDEYLPDHLGLMLATLDGQDLALGRFILINCSEEPNPVVPDFYHPGREIPVERIESCTGLLFGRRELFLELGGFRAVPSSDTDLFNRMRQAGRAWNRASRPSYLYFFGRVRNHLAERELWAARKNRG
jgi:glycosyltransferase involved in cell wall biosynthesis